MARLARLYVPDQPQHVILRGLDQQPAFVDDQDYELFIDCLKAASRDHHLSIHAYALMPGAVQLLVTPTEESSLPKAMQAVGRRYVAHFNRRYARRGTLWEGRYRATVIEGERYFLLASRVVEMCPVRAQLVSAPEDYRWSSYRHHIGLTLDSLITDHPLYWSLGNTPFERQRAYRELCEQPLDEREASQLQQATLKGWVLGSDTYREWAARAANRRVSPLPRGRPRKVRETPRLGCRSWAKYRFWARFFATPHIVTSAVNWQFSSRRASSRQIRGRRPSLASGGAQARQGGCFASKLRHEPIPD